MKGKTGWDIRGESKIRKCNREGLYKWGTRKCLGGGYRSEVSTYRTGPRKKVWSCMLHEDVTHTQIIDYCLSGIIKAPILVGKTCLDIIHTNWSLLLLRYRLRLHMCRRSI